jgi:hypothetical protein
LVGQVNFIAILPLPEMARSADTAPVKKISMTLPLFAANLTCPIEGRGRLAPVKAFQEFSPNLGEYQ